MLICAIPTEAGLPFAVFVGWESRNSTPKVQSPRRVRFEIPTVATKTRVGTLRSWRSEVKKSGPTVPRDFRELRLVLHGHGVRVHGLLAGDAFERGQNP